jgi:hypothetical protein
MPEEFLEGYNSQSTEELPALAGQFRIASLGRRRAQVP